MSIRVGDAGGGGGGGLELLSHSNNNEDVLFLTPNEEDNIQHNCGDEQEPRSTNPKQGETEEDYYQDKSNHAQISILAEDADDLNDDLAVELKSAERTYQQAALSRSSRDLNSNKSTEITYVSDNTLNDVGAELNSSASFNSSSAAHNFIELNTSRQNDESTEPALNASGALGIHEPSMLSPARAEAELDPSRQHVDVYSHMDQHVGNPVDSKSIIDEAILADLKYLFKNTRYFLIKSNNYENVNLAKLKVSFFYAFKSSIFFILFY